MSKIGELFKKANVNDDGTSKKLDSESFLASSREIWEQTLPEGITVEMATQVHLHDQEFAWAFGHAVVARTHEMGKKSKRRGVEAFEKINLPGDLTVNTTVIDAHTLETDCIAGQVDLRSTSRGGTEIVVDKNHPGDLWDF